MLALTAQSPRLSHERCGERSPAACRPGGDRMELERVNPPSLASPSGFSHAVVATGGRLVFLAGQTALDRTGRIVADSVASQFDQALANLLEALDRKSTRLNSSHL